MNWRFWFVAVVGAVWLAACAPAAAPSPSPTPTPDTGAIWTAWRTSPHADDYGLGRGSNTYCARCHSPRNWNPAAKIDPPPNCVSCKFDFEAQPRVARDNLPVAQADWKSIGCEVCHPLSGNTVMPALAWLNTATGQSEPVADATALCNQCHTDTATLRHQRDLGQPAHSGFQCTDCHDPHSTTASCTASKCHAATPTPLAPIAGHDAAHAAVNCVACHDASGLTVGPVEGGTTWMTWRTVELLGQSNTTPYQSHNLQRTVDCARCHYAGNPWKLSAPVSTPASSPPAKP